MARPSKMKSALSSFLAAELHHDLGSQSNWRPCPATQHLHEDYRQTCYDCLGKRCARMLAKGLSDDAAALPPRDRPACRAKTRTGQLCKKKVVPGKHRCGFHGGKSTGPTTSEGKSRIAEAQRKRWAKWRASLRQT